MGLCKTSIFLIFTFIRIMIWNFAHVLTAAVHIAWWGLKVWMEKFANLCHTSELYLYILGVEIKRDMAQGFCYYFAQTVTKSRFAFSVFEFPAPEELTHKDLADVKLSPFNNIALHKKFKTSSLVQTDSVDTHFQLAFNWHFIWPPTCVDVCWLAIPCVEFHWIQICTCFTICFLQQRAQHATCTTRIFTKFHSHLVHSFDYHSWHYFGFSTRFQTTTKSFHTPWTLRTSVQSYNLSTFNTTLTWMSSLQTCAFYSSTVPHSMMYVQLFIPWYISN